jgi:hypothetical protein
MCRFWEETERSKACRSATVGYSTPFSFEGSCHRRAHPWPDRRGVDWCGEFEMKPAPLVLWNLCRDCQRDDRQTRLVQRTADDALFLCEPCERLREQPVQRVFGPLRL